MSAVFTLGSSTRSAAYPTREELLALLAEGIEWVERPVETACDGAAAMWWLERAKAALATKVSA